MFNLNHLLLLSLLLTFCSTTRAEGDEGKLSTTQTGSSSTSFSLNNPSIITKILFDPKTSEKAKYLLGVFEGANDPSFINGIPIHMITEELQNGQKASFTISCSQTFKYIRYVAPNVKSQESPEIEFYGKESGSSQNNGEGATAYQPTGIPLIVIHTENNAQPDRNKNQVNCNIVIINSNKVEINSKGTVRLRGNSTLMQDKKSYRIKFEEKQKLFDLPSSAKKWNLLANHMDKTLLRNWFAFQVSRLFGMDYAPASKSVDVIFNGEYMGSYLLTDQLEVAKNRVPITEMDQSSTQEPEITGGYMLEMTGGGWGGGWGGMGGGGGATSSTFKTTKGINYAIKYPDEEDIIDGQKKYIQEFFNTVESEVYNGITDKVDLDSFVKYFLAEEYCANIDEVWSSFFMTKERGVDKIHFGPVWDFDLALDNDARLYPTNQKEKFTYKYGDSTGTLRDFLIKLLGNENVLKKVKEEFENIKNKVSTDTLVNLLSEQMKLIDGSQKLNFIKWDILNKKIMFENTGRGSYQAEADCLKEFVKGRFESLGKVLDGTTVDNVGEGIEKGSWGGGGGNWGDWGGYGGDDDS